MKGNEVQSEHPAESFIVIGDRVVIRPKSADERTRAGLYLPPGVSEKEKVQSGYIVKTGPGYPIPMHQDADETWKRDDDAVKYIPLQAREGDLAIYVMKDAHELEYNGAQYVIVPQAAILLLIRDDGLFE